MRGASASQDLTHNILLGSIGIVIGYILHQYFSEHFWLFSFLCLWIFVNITILMTAWFKDKYTKERLKEQHRTVKKHVSKLEQNKHRLIDLSQYISSGICNKDCLYDLPKQNILLIGLGCAGINMIDYIVNRSFKKFDTVTIDTDMQKLSQSRAKNCLYLGADRDNVQQISNGQIEYLFQFIHKAKIIFLFTGFGGRTGGFITLQLARYAKKKKKVIHVLAVTPFKADGKKRNVHATVLLKKIKNFVNSVTVISNDDLEIIYGKETKITDSFNMIHEHWLKIIDGICEKPRNHKTIISNQVARIKNEGFHLQ